MPVDVLTEIEIDRPRDQVAAYAEPKGFSKVLAPFMAAAMRRANRKDLTRLKSVLER